MSDATPAPVRIRGLTKAYRKQPVLEGIELTVGAGETLGLVGANGAGKTTLIRCVLDFCRSDGGSIRIFGKGHREEAARARLGYLPERFQPPYFATGRELVTHVAGLHGVRVPGEAVSGAARELDLPPAALDRPVRTLSKGMSQKLGLLAVLLAERDLLLLDEPMSGLDPLARALVKQRLNARRQAGGALLLSTHLLADVEDLCDRVAVLHGGKLVFSGTVAAFADSRPGDTLEQVYLKWVPRAG